MAAEAAAKLGMLSTITNKVSKGEKNTVSDRSDTTSEAATSLSNAADRKKMKKKKKKEEKQKPKSKDSSPSDNDDDDDAAALESFPVPPIKKQRIVIEPQSLYTTDNRPTPWNFKPTPQEGWWGATMFTSAGCLDGMTKDIKAAKRAEFTEDQQEKLYHAAHAGKTQGKVGLGQRSGPVKIGGVKWSGKKVAFEEEEEEEKAKSKILCSNVGEEELKKKKEKKKNKRKVELTTVGTSASLVDIAAGTKAADVSAEWVGSIKWKKVLTKTLETAPGGELKLKALHSAVTASIVQQRGGHGGHSMMISTEHVQVQVENTIAASSKFILQGKKVKLAAKK